MFLSLGIIDIVSTGQKWHMYRTCVFGHTFTAQFAFLAALSPHILRFSPHFRRTFWTFSPHLHRTIWSYWQVRCRTIRHKLSHLNLASGPHLCTVHSPWRGNVAGTANFNDVGVASDPTQCEIDGCTNWCRLSLVCTRDDAGQLFSFKILLPVFTINPTIQGMWVNL